MNPIPNLRLRVERKGCEEKQVCNVEDKGKRKRDKEEPMGGYWICRTYKHSV